MDIIDISIPKVQFRARWSPGRTAGYCISIPKVQFRGYVLVAPRESLKNFNSKGPIQSRQDHRLGCAAPGFQFQRSNSEVPQRPRYRHPDAISIPKVQFRDDLCLLEQPRLIDFNSKGPIQSSCSRLALYALDAFQFQRSNSERSYPRYAGTAPCISIPKVQFRGNSSTRW